MNKRVFVKSSSLDSEICAEFWNDKEWKIIIKCGINANLHFLASGNDKNSPSLALGWRREWVKSSNESRESNATSQIQITFFSLENDIDCLVCGYLATFLGLDSRVNLANLKCENNIFFVDSPLQKSEILSRLAQKDIIQSCEQIELSDKKISRDSVIMPFNGSRANISREILEANRGFFLESENSPSLAINTPPQTPPARGGAFSVSPSPASGNTKNSPSLAEGARGWVNSAIFPYKARILPSESIKSCESSEINKSNESYAQSFDTNPKNAIYKAIGKALGLSLPTESSLRDFATQNRGNPNNLLDSIIFLNFRLDIETLKILILQKCTFIVCAEKPAFSVIRFAQKFGITLIAFVKNRADLAQNANFNQSTDSSQSISQNGDFLILTHQMRFKA